MIDFVQILNKPELVTISAFLMGLIINFDICPLAGDFAILSYVVKKSNGLKKTLPHILFYALGRITAYLALTAVIYFGLSQVNFSPLRENGEKLIGIILIAFGLASLTNKEHCHEHESSDSKKYTANKGLGGSFFWGFLFSLGFCPHSAAIFFGIFMPIALTPPFNILLPVLFGLGASSVIIFFSVLLSLNPDKGKMLLEKLEQKEETTKFLVAVIFILTGLFYLIK